MTDNLVLDIGFTPVEKKKILVVDDEESLRSLIFDVLSDDYALTFSSSGSSGIVKAGEVKPHLIILDLMMADMNGYEFLGVIQSHPELNKIPVVVSTARDFEPSAIKDLESKFKVKGFIHKPFHISDLKALIGKCIK